MVEHKIAERDMIRLVEEVSKLDNERKDQLDKAEVARILDSLGLPTELLDDALLRLRKKQNAEQSRKYVLIGVLGALIIAASAFFFISTNNGVVQGLYAKVTATDAYFSQNAEGSAQISDVSPGQTVYAQVTLHNVPVNSKLPMHAKWYKPDGSILKENSWVTRETTSSNWNTHAKCVIPSDAPVGKWMVEFSLGGRPVISKIFIVK